MYQLLSVLLKQFKVCPEGINCNVYENASTMYKVQVHQLHDCSRETKVMTSHYRKFSYLKYYQARHIAV